MYRQYNPLQTARVTARSTDLIIPIQFGTAIIIFAETDAGFALNVQWDVCSCVRVLN